MAASLPARLSARPDLRRRGRAYIAEFVNWRSAYLAMAALMGMGVVGTLLAPGPTRAPPASAPSLRAGDHPAPGRSLSAQGLMLIPILLLIACFRLPDFVAGVMANPLYIDLGFSKADIANVSKLYGVWIGIIGAFAGGLALTRLGLWWTLFIGAVHRRRLQPDVRLARAGGRRPHLLMLSISIDNFASGFAGSALIAYMSGLTSPGFAALNMRF